MSDFINAVYEIFLTVLLYLGIPVALFALVAGAQWVGNFSLILIVACLLLRGQKGETTTIIERNPLDTFVGG